MLLTSRSMLPVAALGVLFTALPMGKLMSQRWDLDGTRQGPAVESFLTELRIPVDGDRVGAAGIGARLMWNATSLLDRSSSLTRRTEFGLYGAYVPSQGVRGADTFTAWRLGFAGDVRLLASPRARRLDPYLSFGTGLLHSNRTVASARFSPLLRKSVTVLRKSMTAWELTPGAGLRVPIGTGAALQAAVYDGTLLRTTTHHSLSFGLGLRFGV